MIRLFLDANVLFTAAHNPSGKSAFVVELGARGHWQIYTSTYAVEEARRNRALKFPGSEARFEALLRNIKVVPSSIGTYCPIPLREKDRPIFEAALRCKASHLLTGDTRDFGPFMDQPALTSGVIIQTVSTFLAALR